MTTYPSTSQHASAFFPEGAKPDASPKDEDRRIVCKWGKDCRSIEDSSHNARYSHPKA